MEIVLRVVKLLRMHSTNLIEGMEAMRNLERGLTNCGRRADVWVFLFRVLNAY
jgi:hypothetical protein